MHKNEFNFILNSAENSFVQIPTFMSTSNALLQLFQKEKSVGDLQNRLMEEERLHHEIANKFSVAQSTLTISKVELQKLKKEVDFSVKPHKIVDHSLFFRSFFGHRPKCLRHDRKKLSHFGQHV